VGLEQRARDLPPGKPGAHCRYENCRYIILTLSEDGPETEKLQYENGTGLLTLLSTNELQWQDNTGHAADDALFVSEG